MQGLQIDGAKVRFFRERKKFTLAELAMQMGVSRGFIHLLETGKTGISRENLTRLVSVLGIEEGELSPRAVQGREPKWLKFLDVKHSLSDEDKKLLKRLVKQSGIPCGTDEMVAGEVEDIWENFYKSVQSFLSNPNQKFFEDRDVRRALTHLGLSEPFDWVSVRRVICEQLDFLRNDYQGDMAGERWKQYVSQKLKVKVVDLYECSPEECIAKCHGDWSIIGGVARVASNPLIYGAIYKSSDGNYVYIGDSRGEKSERGDYPFWHEIARRFVDPDLKLGKGAVYYPDGDERPPLEKLLCRLASWIAFGFLEEKDFSAREWHAVDGRLSMEQVCQFHAKYYPRSTIRMAAWVLIDSCNSPIMYVDAYLRLKELEYKQAGIKVSDIEAMAQHENARLRIGFVMKNIAAECSLVTLRFNLRVSESSFLYKSFWANKNLSGMDDLSQWDEDYHLNGKVWVSPLLVNDKVRHVKAILNILANDAV